MDENLQQRKRPKAKRRLSTAFVVAVAVVGGHQVLDSDSPLRTQVLGATAKKPDVTPPAVSVAFPVANGSYGLATWGPIRGSASDSSGISKVEVRLDNGAWTTAQGGTSWSLSLPLPAPDGTHTISVRATDGAAPAANESNPPVTSFRVDTSIPAKPSITSAPDNPSFDRDPQFKYSAEAGATFECQLDGNAKPCGSSVSYKKLSFGDHTFQVVAIDAAGNRSPASEPFTWTVLENKAFGVTGDITEPLYPGVTRRLDLLLSNPYNFPIQVTGISVSAESATTNGHRNDACIADLSINGLTAGPAVVIPADSSRPLSGFLTPGAVWPATWPTIEFENDPDRNQDSCKDTVFTLSYTGTATKP